MRSNGLPSLSWEVFPVVPRVANAVEPVVSDRTVLPRLKKNLNGPRPSEHPFTLLGLDYSPSVRLDWQKTHSVSLLCFPKNS